MVKGMSLDDCDHSISFTVNQWTAPSPVCIQRRRVCVHVHPAPQTSLSVVTHTGCQTDSSGCCDSCPLRTAAVEDRRRERELNNTSFMKSMETFTFYCTCVFITYAPLEATRQFSMNQWLIAVPPVLLRFYELCSLQVIPLCWSLQLDYLLLAPHWHTDWGGEGGETSTCFWQSLISHTSVVPGIHIQYCYRTIWEKCIQTLLIPVKSL